jgi:hypothetical protein
LNIKNAEAVRLINELAQETGEGKTEAVTKAVEARLELIRGEKNKGMAERLMELGREFRREWGDEPVPDIDALLYDPETGLPRED